MDDRLRLDIADTAPEVGGFQVLVYVNDVEITASGAGLGMSPFDLLIPTNRLRADLEPHQVPIARCDCGVYGCGMTDTVIVRDGDLIRWDWRHEVPMDHAVTFRADQYDAELDRIEADHSWERPEDTTARLILEQADHAALQVSGLRISWVDKDYSDHDLMLVALAAGVDDQTTAYQVFLRVPRRDRPVHDVVDEVVDELARSPRDWRATWHAVSPTVSAPPSIAGPGWLRERVW